MVQKLSKRIEFKTVTVTAQNEVAALFFTMIKLLLHNLTHRFSKAAELKAATYLLPIS